MNATPCLNRQQLTDYLLGKSSERELQAVADHLERCSRCQAAVESLEGQEDSFIRELCRPTGDGAYEGEAELQRVLGQARAAARQIARERPRKATRSPSVRIAEPPGVFKLGRLGEYELLEGLGHGGMGRVYKALHTRLEKVVAVKVLPPDRIRDEHAVARFQREMKAVGRLEHPNLVRAMDAGQVKERHFLVMEYVDGSNLSQLVRCGGPLPIADACELIRQAAVGLQHAHEHGLVHRDIKPSNLMLSVAGQVKVLDLGLACSEVAGAADAELTGTGQVLGTTDYMSPEQALDTHTVDIRADVYSLGCTLYKLLCGRAPFGGSDYDTPLKKVTGHARDAIPPIRSLRADVPRELAAVIDRMLAKDRNRRFATPGAVADALAPLCAGCDLRGLLTRVKRGAKPPADLEDSRETFDQSRPSVPTGAEQPIPEMAVPPPRPAESAFDPYHRWLAIPPEEQPPHFYRLLGLKLYENNADVIESAADRQMTHLRAIQAGEHAELAQKLLNEISRARVCLLSRQKRLAYDKALRMKLQAESTIEKKPSARAPVDSAAPRVDSLPPPVDPELAGLLQKADHQPSKVQPLPRREPRIPRRWLMAGLGAAALLLTLGIVLYVATNKGTIAITLSDPEAEVSITVDGDVVEIAGLEDPLRLRAGEHELYVTGKDYETISRSFTVRRGKEDVLNVKLVRHDKVVTVAPPVKPTAETIDKPIRDAVSQAKTIRLQYEWQGDGKLFEDERKGYAKDITKTIIRFFALQEVADQKSKADMSVRISARAEGLAAHYVGSTAASSGVKQTGGRLNVTLSVITEAGTVTKGFRYEYAPPHEARHAWTPWNLMFADTGVYQGLMTVLAECRGWKYVVLATGGDYTYSQAKQLLREREGCWRHAGSGVKAQPFLRSLSKDSDPAIRKAAETALKGIRSRTPLSEAAEWGDDQRIRLLLEDGDDPNTLDAEGGTPLYRAILNRHSSSARLLLEERADVDRGNSDGVTPLMSICRQEDCDLKLVEELLKRGADPNAKDKYGHTVLLGPERNIKDAAHRAAVTALLRNAIDKSVGDAVNGRITIKNGSDPPAKTQMSKRDIIGQNLLLDRMSHEDIDYDDEKKMRADIKVLKKIWALNIGGAGGSYMRHSDFIWTPQISGDAKTIRLHIDHCDFARVVVKQGDKELWSHESSGLEESVVSPPLTLTSPESGKQSIAIAVTNKGSGAVQGGVSAIMILQPFDPTE